MKALIVCIVAGVALSGCVAPSDGGGVQAPFDEEELTQSLPLVVEAEVLTERVVKLKDDPSLPDDWESRPNLKEAVDSGVARRKWEIRINQWLKGRSPERIHVFRPASHGGPGWMVSAEGEFEGLPELKLGKRFRFWLQPDEDVPDQYFLNAAKQV